jgi:hypothetical protein
METVKELLFERPLAIYVALFFAEAICLMVLWRLRSRRALAAALAPLVLGAVVYILSSVVVTEHKRLMMALDSLRDAVVAGDTDAASTWIDDTYEDRQHDKRSALAAIRVAAGMITAVNIDQVKAQLQDGKAEMTDLKAIAQVRSSLGSDVPLTMHWQLWWVRRPVGWRLTSSRLEASDLLGSSFPLQNPPRGP